VCLTILLPQLSKSAEESDAKISAENEPPDAQPQSESSANVEWPAVTFLYVVTYVFHSLTLPLPASGRDSRAQGESGIVHWDYDNTLLNSEGALERRIAQTSPCFQSRKI
jgi:hypothetical protein